MFTLTATQIRELDRFTNENEPITSIDLMEGLPPLVLIIYLKMKNLLQVKPSKFLPDKAIIKAHLTLSFLPVKRAFLFPENKSHYGEIVYLDIGLL
jgi:hypothetical protein